MLYISKAGGCIYIYTMYFPQDMILDHFYRVLTLFGGQRTLKSGKGIRDHRIG